MGRLARLFDDRFEEVSRITSRGAVVRVVTALLTAGLIVATVSVRTAVLWGAVFAAGEVWGYLAMRPMAGGSSASTVQRLHLAIAAAAAVSVWVAPPVIYWLTGSPALRFVAACSLMAILLTAQTQSTRSPAMLAIVSAPPLLALAVLALGFGGFHGLGLVMVGLVLAMVLGHLLSGAAHHRKAAEHLEQLQREAVAANQAKSAFLAMMSHEIRTPMNGVLGMAHVLAAGPLGEEQRRQVEMLTRSGDGLMTILNDILDLSKIEAGKLTLEETAFDLHDLVGSICDLWRASAEAKGLAFVCDIDPAVPHWVLGDPTRVRQVLLNHVSNAVKFSERGEIALSVAPAVPQGVTVTVRDTGVGLTPAQLERLFQPFSQADASTTRRFGGTGLGLSISRQLTALMGGDIAVSSTPGAGTEFRVTLPLPAAAAASTADDETELDVSGLRILVAEDNLINQAVVQAILASIDAQVDLAGDGAEAIERLRAEDYDIVLMDIHMPGVDGIEALRRIRAGEAGRPDQAVIALTADAMAGNEERFLALGFDAVESKPIQPGRLFAAIGAVCATRAQQRYTDRPQAA